MNSNFGLFDIFFNIMPFFMMIIFIAVIGIFVFVIAKSIKQNRFNKAQPVLTVQARIVSKRSDTHYSSNVGENSGGSSYTWHYATFEVKSGDRMELTIPQNEIGYLAEGDTGELTFQGTEYKSFARL